MLSSRSGSENNNARNGLAKLSCRKSNSPCNINNISLFTEKIPDQFSIDEKNNSNHLNKIFQTNKFISSIKNDYYITFINDNNNNLNPKLIKINNINNINNNNGIYYYINETKVFNNNNKITNFILHRIKINSILYSHSLKIF